MATLVRSITTSPNDGTYTSDGGQFFPVASNANAGHVGGDYWNAWLRFTNLTIPQGATITSAVLTVEAQGSSGSGWQTEMFAEAADDPASPSTAADAIGRTRTTASVGWSPTSWVTNAPQSSPDLATVLQEVIDRPGWSSGNALILLWDSVSGATGAHLSIYQLDGAGAVPTLTVEYAEGPPPPPSGSATGSHTWSAAATGTGGEPPPIVGYDQLVLSKNPHVYLPLDETSGTTADDLADGDNNGTHVGAVSPGVATPLGVCADYQNGGCTTIPNGAGISSPTALAVGFILDKDVANEENFAFYLGTSTTRTFAVNLAWTDGNVYFDTSAGTSSSISDWDRSSKAIDFDLTQPHSFWFTKDPATGKQEMWVDGVLWHSASGMTRPIGTPTVVTVGGQEPGLYPIDARIGRFVILPQVPDATEMAELHEALTRRVGTASGSHSWSGLASGTTPVGSTPTGSATGGHSWAGSAEGSTTHSGEAADTHAWSGVAGGTPPVTGAATGTHGWTGVAEGSHVSSGEATGAAVWAGVATGTTPDVTPATGSGAGTHTWFTTATGAAPDVPEASGVATGNHGWTGTAEGSRAPIGSAAAEHAWTGTSSGHTTPNGTTAGSYGWAGQAAGRTPTVGAHNGTATGTCAWTGDAEGYTRLGGRSAGGHQWTADTTGRTVRHGATQGSHQWSGRSVGLTRQRGRATGAHAWGATVGGQGTDPGRNITVTASLAPRHRTAVVSDRRHASTLTHRTRSAVLADRDTATEITPRRWTASLEEQP